jgi:hypothetical protein
MLEEIEVPPDLIHCVVRLTAWTSTLGTRELAAPRKIDIDIEPLLFRVKRTTLHQPRRKQSKGRLKEVGVLHRLLLLEEANYQKLPLYSTPSKIRLPTNFSEEPENSKTVLGPNSQKNTFPMS